MVRKGDHSKLYIGGEWVTPRSAAKIGVVSPLTEELIATVPSASREDIDAAVATARRAFDTGRWPRMDVRDRAAIVARLRDAFVGWQEPLAQTITDEMGSPITASRTQQTAIPIRMLDAQLEIAARYPWRELRRCATGNGLVVRKPKGVVAAIVPWNAPMMATINKIGPALLAGNCVILKPAPESPLSAYMLAEMISECGFPEGVVSVLPADRAESEYLALHPGVDKVSFTGSTVAGRALARACGERLRPITLELGGKSAALLLEDADLPAAIDALRIGSFRNSGQICSLKTRIVVSRRQEAEVLERLGALIDDMPVGDPNDPATQIGPMVSKRQRDRIEAYIATGLREGGTAIRGGCGMPDGIERGWFVRPTVIAGVDPNATIAQEEIFGPVLAVMTYDSEDEAIAIANNSAYGLNGAVFSEDPDRALRVAGRIHTGAVEINGSGIGLMSPAGGVKASGIGREQGPEGFDPYIEFAAIGLPEALAERLESRGGV